MINQNRAGAESAQTQSNSVHHNDITLPRRGWAEAAPSNVQPEARAVQVEDKVMARLALSPGYPTECALNLSGATPCWTSPEGGGPVGKS